MEIIQDYAHQALTLYNTMDPYLRPVRQVIYQAQAQLTPLLLPTLNRLALLAHDSPAIISLGVLILFLLIAMQILNLLRRVMVFWMRLMVRVTFWGCVVLLVSAVCQSGVERTVDDVVGWGKELGVVWVREYRRWEGYQNQYGQK